MRKKDVREEIDGKIYTSIAALARDYSANFSTVLNRYNRGVRGKDLVTKRAVREPMKNHQSRKNNDGFPLEIEGVVYTKIADVAKKYNINKATLRNRINNGFVGDEIVKPVKTHINTGRSITINGNEYPSITAAAAALSCDYQKLTRLYSEGYRDNELLAKVKKQQKWNRFAGAVIFGTKYDSFRDIALKFNVPEITLRNRYKNGARNEQLIYGYKKSDIDLTKQKLPKYIAFDDSREAYTFQRTYKKETVSKSRKKFDDIMAISRLVDDYIKIFDRLPRDLGNDNVKIDYDNILGKQFGELFVKGVVLEDNRRKLWCVCSCGKEGYYIPTAVVNEKIKSCGHLAGFTLKQKNDELKEIQRNRDVALSSNKSTGQKYISFNKGKNAFDFEIKRSGIRLRNRFKTLDQAIKYKYKVLDYIKSNDGKLPSKEDLT
ncbi:UNVERIFIED_CONTAM: hypothetical protein KB581_08855 [Streptococcus canis]|nr:hypothetical protein Javan87_0003 [Streptococcus phage Javan87]QBX31997.1 hypothetical protein Javan90_0003 [Streptococcus phage Javan90]